MNLYIVFAFVVISIACCSPKKENTLPAPFSVSAVETSLRGKTFLTKKIGTISPFADKMDKEKPNRWFDEEKELNDFAKEYQKERMKFILHFVNDTLLRITDDGNSWEAVYKIDEQQMEKEKPGIKLRCTYPDKKGIMNFPGASGPMMLTSTYLISGIGNQELVIETPREFNSRKVVIWMKEK